MWGSLPAPSAVRLPGGCKGQGEDIGWHVGMQRCWHGVKKLS